DSKVSLYKDKGGRMMICHPYLVTKRMTRHTPLLQEQAHLCAVRDKQDPLSCLNEAGKLACVSPEERA
ncbi:hypothetical protein, partial [Exiguobacterium sp.]|uniref:hypothetical protein n=1 Tax=Exiguobacterium sp. TaxID=44751 RepID=UPI0028AD8650